MGMLIEMYRPVNSKTMRFKVSNVGRSCLDSGAHLSVLLGPEEGKLVRAGEARGLPSSCRWVASIHSIAEKRSSQKLGCRFCPILGNSAA